MIPHDNQFYGIAVFPAGKITFYPYFFNIACLFDNLVDNLGNTAVFQYKIAYIMKQRMLGIGLVNFFIPFRFRLQQPRFLQMIQFQSD